MSRISINIYPLVPTKTGVKPGDVFLAQVDLVGEQVKITCYDEELKVKLGDIFSTPIIRRTPVGGKSGLVSHANEVVEPFTEEFFDEVLYHLRRYKLHGKLRK